MVDPERNVVASIGRRLLTGTKSNENRLDSFSRDDRSLAVCLHTYRSELVVRWAFFSFLTLFCLVFFYFERFLCIVWFSLCWCYLPLSSWKSKISTFFENITNTKIIGRSNDICSTFFEVSFQISELNWTWDILLDMYMFITEHVCLFLWCLLTHRHTACLISLLGLHLWTR